MFSLIPNTLSETFDMYSIWNIVIYFLSSASEDLRLTTSHDTDGKAVTPGRGLALPMSFLVHLSHCSVVQFNKCKLMLQLIWAIL